MDIELEKLKKLEHALCDAIDILRDWQVEEVKPECPCADSIDFKACVGCEHSEAGKPRINKNYRPYESSAEMIMDFKDRFKADCPPYCEPLIWVKSKVTDSRFLIGTFCEDTVKLYGDTSFNFESLFKWHTYLDGSPVGMEVKE